MEFQISGNYGSGGISLTAGDQRDTGSGYSSIKVIPESGVLLQKDMYGVKWEYQIHCTHQIGKGGFGVVYLGYKTYKNQNTGETVKKGSYAIKELKHSTDKEKSSQSARFYFLFN